VERRSVQCAWRSQKLLNLFGYWTLKSHITWIDNIKVDHTGAVSFLEDERSALLPCIRNFTVKILPRDGWCSFPQILYKIRDGTLNMTATASFHIFSTSLLNGLSVIYWPYTDLSQASLKPEHLDKYCGELWIELVWVRIWQVADCCWHGNEPSGFMKCGRIRLVTNSVWRRAVPHGVGQCNVLRRSHKLRLFECQ
jgi:hypothetical protein